MKPSLPWRTLAPSRETGRFTPEQLDAAVLEVMERGRYTNLPGRPLFFRERGPGWGRVESDASADTARASGNGVNTSEEGL